MTIAFGNQPPRTPPGAAFRIASCVAVLAACFAADSATLAAQRAGAQSLSPAAHVRLIPAAARRPNRTWENAALGEDVFLADAADGLVDIFDSKSGKQSGAIAGLQSPEGLATGPGGKLYVANTLAQTIEIYTKPYARKPAILSDSGFFPVGVYADDAGDIFVANICSGSQNACSGDGNTVVYFAGTGSQKPSLLPGGPSRAYFVARDAHANVWVDGQVSAKSPTSEIGYFPLGRGIFTPIPIGFAFPGGIAFDASDDLLLDDQGGAPNGASILNVYPPGFTSPTRSIVLQNDGDDIIDIALGNRDTRIYAPDYFAGTANVITYPAGTTIGTLTPTVIGELDAVAVATRAR